MTTPNYPPGYYASILQLREITQEMVEAVKKHLSKNNIFVGKIVPQANGVDYYLDTHQSAKSLGKLLQQQFGGKLQITAKLHGYERTKGKRIYRLTVLFRALPVKKGDDILYKGERYTVKGIAASILAINQKTKEKVRIPLSEGKKIQRAER